MLRLYDYECLHCGTDFEAMRDQEEVYDEIACPDCGKVSDGKKAKRIRTAATVTYKQGNLKGKMNNYGR